MNDDIKSSPDLFYLVERRKHEPKESFKFTATLVKSFVDTIAHPQIADIGCATGEFIYFMHTVFPHATYHGYDISPELVARGKEEVPFAEVGILDITKKEDLPAARYDLVFMNGVNGAFEDPLQWLPSLVSLLNETGRAYVYGIFNPRDLDVIVRVKEPEKPDAEPISYWNNISQKTIRRIAKNLGFEAIFHPFEIGIDLPSSDINPFRSWTMTLEDGRRLLINGTQVLHNFYLLELRR